MTCIKMIRRNWCYGGDIAILFQPGDKYANHQRNCCYHHDLGIDGRRNFLRHSRRLEAQGAEKSRTKEKNINRGGHRGKTEKTVRSL